MAGAKTFQHWQRASWRVRRQTTARCAHRWGQLIIAVLKAAHVYAPDLLQIRAHLCTQRLHVLCTHETTLLTLLYFDLLLWLWKLVALCAQTILRQVQETARYFVPDSLEDLSLVRLWWFSDVS